MIDTKNILKTIKNLSENIEKTTLESQFQKLNEAINLEYKQLKDHVKILRAELEKEKEKYIKDIDHLMQSEALKRNELEHTIQDLRSSIEKQISKQDEIKKKLNMEAQRMEVYYKDSLSKLRNQFKKGNE